MQPATGLEGAHGSPKYPPWQPSDMDQASIQTENKGLCSHKPGAVVVHYSEGSLVVVHYSEGSLVSHQAAMLFKLSTGARFPLKFSGMPQGVR